MSSQRLVPLSPRHRARHTSRARHSAILETLESRTLMTANLTVLGGPYLANIITDGATTTNFQLYTDFGVNDINNTVETRDFYAFDGDASSPINLTGNPLVAVTGDTTDFTISVQPSKNNLQPTDSSSPTDYVFFTIQFVPHSAGAKSAVITMPTDDPNHPNFHFTVTGTGAAPTSIATGNTEVITTQTGSGPTVQSGDILVVNYTGYLLKGTIFDSSLNPGRTPFIFQIGQHSVITGWDNGFLGMQVGQSATLIIPSDQAYGANGNGSIPGNSTLLFSVTLLQKISPNFVTKLYQDILGRAPDQAGSDSWIQQIVAGTTPAQVTANFLNSTEYRTLRIQALYHTVFNRDADADGLTAWLAYLAAGNTIEQMESQFYGSTEFYNANGGTTDSVIDAMYVIFLNRHAEPDGLTYWENQISSGASWPDVALQLIRSNEGGQDTVTRLYEQYLGREPDTDGLNYWSGLLAGGSSESDVVAGFLSSQEFYSS